MLANNLAESQLKLKDASNHGIKKEAKNIHLSKMSREEKSEESSDEENWETVRRKGDRTDKVKKRRKTEKCRFFELFNNCKFSDDDCFNSHPRTECKSFRDLGKCKNGSCCLESHASGKIDCPFFKTGKCMFNDSCKFYHNKKSGNNKKSANDRRRTVSVGNLSPIRPNEGILKSPGRSFSQSSDSSVASIPKGLIQEVTKIVLQNLSSNQQSEGRRRSNSVTLSDRGSPNAWTRK